MKIPDCLYDYMEVLRLLNENDVLSSSVYGLDSKRRELHLSVCEHYGVEYKDSSNILHLITLDTPIESVHGDLINLSKSKVIKTSREDKMHKGLVNFDNVKKSDKSSIPSEDWKEITSTTLFTERNIECTIAFPRNPEIAEELKHIKNIGADLHLKIKV